MSVTGPFAGRQLTDGARGTGGALVFAPRDRLQLSVRILLDRFADGGGARRRTGGVRGRDAEGREKNGEGGYA